MENIITKPTSKMELGKLYKCKTTDLIVKCTSPSYNDYTFGGIAITGDEIHEIGCINSGWLVDRFDEYHKSNPTASQIGGNHYKDCKIQPTEFIHANGIPFIEGNIIKYIVRHRNKNGVEDLKKAKHYIDLLIQFEYENKESI